MKGSQGLEALAALCGGASKVDESGSASAQAPSVIDQAAAVIAPPANVIPTTYPTNPANDGGARSSAPPAHQAPAAPVPASQHHRWAHQAMAAAAASTLASAPAAAAVGALLQAALQPHNAPPASAPAPDAASTQHLAYYHYVQAQAAAAAQASQLAHQQPHNQQPHSSSQAAPPQASNTLADPNSAVAIALAAHQHAQAAAAAHKAQPPKPANTHHQQQVLQTSAPSAVPAGSVSGVVGNNMQPPSPQVPTISSCPAPAPVAPSPQVAAPAVNSAPGVLPIAAAPPAPRSSASGALSSPSLQPQPLVRRPSNTSEPAAAAASVVVSTEDKKQLKRAANRRSAQLSRKRKKQFIEELKEENDKLRRKEQILRSIPDLIVVFDSAGRLWFVSHSVKRFLDFGPSELEGSSFWDRLCDESVRLLKAAFMDALAARFDGSDTVPLGSGVWELRLVNRDGSHKLVTLNGVVHFSGETPECVCSIRPREINENHLRSSKLSKACMSLESSLSVGGADAVTVSSKASSAPFVHFQTNLVRDAIKPQQSVISNGSSDDTSVKITKGKAQQGVPSGGAQISDNESVVSE